LGKSIEPTIFCLDGVGSIGPEFRLEGPRIEVHGCDPLRLAAKVRDHRIQILHVHKTTSFLHAAIAKARLLNRVRLVVSADKPSSRETISPLRRGRPLVQRSPHA
jgi:hypothetical protein